MGKADKTTRSLFDDVEIKPQEGEEQAPRDEIVMFREIIGKIYDKSDIELKTDLNLNQIMAFASAEVLYTEYNLTPLSKYAKNIMNMSISKNRKGRKEFENIVINSFSTFAGAKDEMPMSIPDRLLGRK